MICSKIKTTDDVITSVHIREALHDAFEDGRLKEGAADAGDIALHKWLRQEKDQTDLVSSSSSSSSSSDDDYDDDHQELDVLSSSDKETDGETLCDSDDTRSSVSQDDYDYPSPGTTDTDSDPYEYNSEYESSSSDC